MPLVFSCLLKVKCAEDRSMTHFWERLYCELLHSNLFLALQIVFWWEFAFLNGDEDWWRLMKIDEDWWRLKIDEEHSCIWFIPARPCHTPLGHCCTLGLPESKPELSPPSFKSWSKMPLAMAASLCIHNVSVSQLNRTKKVACLRCLDCDVEHHS